MSAKRAPVGKGAARAKRSRPGAGGAARELHAEEELLGAGRWRFQDVVVVTEGTDVLRTMCRACTAMRAMGLGAAGEPPDVHRITRTSSATAAGEFVERSARRTRRAAEVGPDTALLRVPDGVVRDSTTVWTWGYEMLRASFGRGVGGLEPAWERVAGSERCPVEAPGLERDLVAAPMFEYQWRCAGFMLRREAEAAASRRHVAWTLSDGKKHLSLRDWSLARGPGPSKAPAGVLEMRGGCVLDEPGMGKTREVLAAALLDREPGAAAPRGLTLVVCKSHLAAQWIAEAATLGLAARRCVTVPQLSGLTLAALRATSVLVVSLSTLERYIGAECWARDPGRQCRARRGGVPIERVHFRRVVVDEAHTVLATDPRVLSVNAATRFLSELTADFRWAVTGTPSLLQARALAWFLGLRLNGARIVDPMHGLPRYRPLAAACERLLGAATVRRTVRARLAERLPELHISTLPVDMTAEEARFVNSMSTSDGVRRALCHPQAAPGGSRPGEVRVMRVADLLAERLRGAEAELAKAQLRMDREDDAIARALAAREAQAALRVGSAAEEATRAERVGDLDRELESRRRTLAEHARRRDRERGNVAYLRNAAGAPEEACVVCMEPMHGVRAVTDCGHSTCGSCMDALLEVSRRCPVCREPIGPTTITRIRDPAPAAESKGEDDPGAAALRAKFGSKTAAVARWLTDTLEGDPEARVIVYCMYDRYLHIMEHVFREQGIGTAWIAGHAAQRGAVVAEFQAGRVQVLLASLAQAAEGLNLTRGTHVLFVHPMDEAQHDLVRQAGGRIYRLGQTAKRVHYVYAYTRNTIEQVLIDRYPAGLKPSEPDPPK